jgi:hypothetical protein
MKPADRPEGEYFKGLRHVIVTNRLSQQTNYILPVLPCTTGTSISCFQHSKAISQSSLASYNRLDLFHSAPSALPMQPVGRILFGQLQHAR